MQRLNIRTLTLITLMSILVAGASAEATQHCDNSDRSILFISDLHMGLGRLSDNGWNPLEDFRWPHALDKFLARISRDHHDRVTLVIVGDFLELWQHPSVPCAYSQATPCSVDQMTNVAELAVSAHNNEFRMLGNFANRGENHLSIIPGNHDAALMVPQVWQVLSTALGGREGRIDLVKSGLWTDCDGTVVSEHGHQIGADLNKYPDWPKVVLGDRRTMFSPWGEWFVETLFNSTEDKYPMIDNVIPQSNGLAYYEGDHGAIGSAAEVARFILLNIFETSIAQKRQVLGPSGRGHEGWNTSRGRSFGYRLFADSLPAASYLRQRMLAENDPHFDELRKAFDDLAKDQSRLSEEQVRSLCDLLAIRAAQSRDARIRSCNEPSMGLAVQELSFAGDDELIKARLEELMGSAAPNVRLYVFGHTHQMDNGTTLSVKGENVRFINDGAFQRLIDERTLDSLIVKHQRPDGLKMSRGEAMRLIPLSELPPCYSFVQVSYRAGNSPSAELHNWKMAETDAEGSIVAPDSPGCADLLKPR